MNNEEFLHLRRLIKAIHDALDEYCSNTDYYEDVQRADYERYDEK